MTVPTLRAERWCTAPYCSPQLVVKLAKTRPYEPPVFEDMPSDTCLEVDAPERVHNVIANHVKVLG